MFGSKVAIALCLSTLVYIVGANGQFGQSDGFALFDTYSELNSYLEGQVKSTDNALNIEAVSNLQNSPESYSFNNREDLSDAISLFKSLQTLNDGNVCTAESARVLKNNYYAAFGYPEAGLAQSVEHRQINQVIKNFCLFHAKTCPSVYLPKWEATVRSMDPEVERVVSHMFEKLLEKSGVDKSQVMNDREMLTQLARGIMNLFFMANNYANDMLKEIAHEDPDVKYLTPSGGRLDMEKVNELSSKYMAAPCNSYTSTLEDVFESAEVDSFVGSDVDNMNFHQSWAKYRFCKFLVQSLIIH